MSFFTDTVTLYNYHKDPTTKVKTWNRTIIETVQYKKSSDKTISGDGKISLTDTVTLTIPFFSATKPFINPRDYMKLSTSEAVNYFTLNDNDNLDVFILGSIFNEIVIPDPLDEDPPTQYTITDLLKEYYNACVISAFRDNTNRDGLKHWVVVGS